MKTNFFLTIFTAFIFSTLSKAEINVSHAIAMHGQPKYNIEF